MTEKSWNIGGPGGPAGPFYSVVKPDGQIVAMQILTQEMAELIASIPQLQAEVERLRERLAEQSVDEAAAMIWNNAEFHRDTWRDASDWHWLRGLLEEVAELCLALAGLHRHWMTTRADTIEWELRQIGGIVLNWLRRRS